MSNSLFVQLFTEMGWDTQFKKYSALSFTPYFIFWLLAPLIIPFISSL